jgi:hypothetical protein
VTDSWRPKLGELLVERHVVSARALQEALELHRKGGRRLGSALVRLGLLEIDTLAQYLSQQLGFPAADRALLRQMEPRALGAIPAELRSKYQIVPLRLEGRRLHLAAVNPHYRALMEHLSTALQVQIQPYVLPEELLAPYLAHAESMAGPDTPSTTLELESSDPSIDLIYLDEVTTAAAADSHASEPDIDISIEIESAGDARLETLLERLERAERAEDVISALLQPPLPDVRIVVLLLPRGDVASLLGARGTDLPPAEARALVVPLNVPSLLHRAASERRTTAGQTKGDSVQAMIATFLRRPPAPIGCAVPVSVRGRLMNLLYLQTAEPVPAEALGQLSRLAEAAGQAYARLIERQRGRASVERNDRQGD